MRPIVGWIIRRKIHGVFQYANGAGGWVFDRRRAFLFTDVGKRKGLDDGRKWAHAHRRELAGGFNSRALSAGRVVRVRR